MALIYRYTTLSFATILQPAVCRRLSAEVIRAHDSSTIVFV